MILHKIISTISKVGIYLASLVLVSLVCLILLEIFGRSFFDYSTMLADEYSGYFFLSLSFLGFAYTFEQKGHIRINLITSRLSEETKVKVDMVCAILALITLIYALVYSFLAMLESKDMEMVSEGVSETPIYLTQIPIIIGLSFLILALISFFLKRLKDDI